MGDNNQIDANYVDPNLLAQYDEEDNYNPSQYVGGQETTPQYNTQQYNTNGELSLLETILEQAVMNEASDVHLLVRLSTSS